MPMRVPISEASLRRAMRDDRYWLPGHPERQAYAGWVSDGYRALGAAGSGGGGVVFVRAYVRMRAGRTEHVAAHQRSAPPHGGARDGMGAVRLAQLLTPRFFARPPTGPLPPGTPMQRIPRQSGRGSARDIPDWAHGRPRHVGETPTQ